MIPLHHSATFPADYREAEARPVLEAVFRLRSITVAGLAGMGKSNLARFVAFSPQAHKRYLKERAGQYRFVYVDCSALVEGDEAGILDEIAAQFQRLWMRAESTGSALDARRLLKELVLAVEPELTPVLILDGLDQVQQALNRSLFNYLGHLRNARPLRNLVYILVTRRPPEHLYELQELMDDPCFIRPLVPRDAQGLLDRDQVRLNYTFDPAVRERLIACTGGHPGLLKNAGELVASGRVDGRLPEAEMARQMLQSEKVCRLGLELWADLSGAEQAVLLNVTRAVPSGGTAEASFLEQNGLLKRVPRDGADELALFCPLFAALVQDQAGSAGAVRITAVFPNQARIEAVAGEKRIVLAPRLFALLSALAEAPGRVLTNDVIIAQVYGDEADGVSDAALAQLVKRLRSLLDPVAREMSGDPTFTSVETVWGVGYRFCNRGR